MIIQITFEGQLNDSIQLGDLVYYMPTTSLAGFNTSDTDLSVFLGPVNEIIEMIEDNSYHINVDYDNSTAPTIPSGSFYMFKKDKTVNLASVLGYYAEVQFVNNSSKRSEMFSVGSIAQLNSK